MDRDRNGGFFLGAIFAAILFFFFLFTGRVRGLFGGSADAFANAGGAGSAAGGAGGASGNSCIKTCDSCGGGVSAPAKETVVGYAAPHSAWGAQTSQLQILGQHL